MKLLPKDDLALDKSLRLQSAGNSKYKCVASKPKKSIKSIEQWTSAFLKFLAVYSEKYPKQIPAVIKHGEIVRELASRCLGLAWLTYDKQVRKNIEVRSIPWGQLHYEYWVMATTFRQPPTQFNFHGKHVQQRVPYRNRIPQGFCYAFHKNGKCSNQQCQYKHICFQCKKTHSILHCTWGDKSNPRGANPSSKVNNHHCPQANKLVVTPVKVTFLGQFLEGYDDHLRTFLCEGFQQGFKIQYQGPRQHRSCKNLLSVQQHENIVAKKLQKEVSLCRIAGPFSSPFFLICNAPLLVLYPKKKLMNFG